MSDGTNQRPNSRGGIFFLEIFPERDEKAHIAGLSWKELATLHSICSKVNSMRVLRVGGGEGERPIRVGSIYSGQQEAALV